MEKTENKWANRIQMPLANGYFATCSELPLPQTFKSMPGTLIAGKPLTQRHRETSCSTNSVLTMSPPKTPRSTRASARSLEPVTPNKSRKSDVPSAPVKTSKAKKMMTLP